MNTKCISSLGFCRQAK